ncbi:hypothetical protein RIF29_20752 [Crotalaria pallida]|uniref:Uncharacterized protein n=1 Tax=Crotalaria pallida TaxID=3830 RepID=A0AAN9F1N7_CROPI
MAAVWYHVWMERNRRLFAGKSRVRLVSCLQHPNQTRIATILSFLTTSLFSRSISFVPRQTARNHHTTIVVSHGNSKTPPFDRFQRKRTATVTGLQAHRRRGFLPLWLPPRPVSIARSLLCLVLSPPQRCSVLSSTRQCAASSSVLQFGSSLDNESTLPMLKMKVSFFKFFISIF